MLKNYTQKMIAMAKIQSINKNNCLCALSFKVLEPYRAGNWLFDRRRNEKLDFAHILSRTKINRRKYPNFIDSIFNGVLALHSEHIGSNSPNAPTNEAMLYADEIEQILTNPPEHLKYNVELLRLDCDVDSVPDKEVLVSAMEEVIDEAKKMKGELK